MKPVFLNIFVLLLSSSGLSGIGADQSEDGIQIDQSGEVKTQIIDSNDGQTQANLDKDFDLSNFTYKGDPIDISCVYEENQTQFLNVLRINETTDKFDNHPLVEELCNGNDLTLYIDGANAKNYNPKGVAFKRAKASFTKSGRNVCYVSHGYQNFSVAGVKGKVEHMVKDQRLEFVGKMTGDFVFAVRNKCLEKRRGVQNLSSVDIAGGSIGAHMAGRACRYLEVLTGEKVRFLLALDPAGISYIVNKKLFPQSGFAQLVQTVHTSIIIGTNYRIADEEIYMKIDTLGLNIMKTAIDRHVLVMDVYSAIAAKKLTLVATINGRGTVYEFDALEDLTLKENQCIVGVYTNDKYSSSRKGKSFHVFLTKKQLTNSLGDLYVEFKKNVAL